MEFVTKYDVFKGFLDEDVPRVDAIMARGLQPDPRFHTDALGVVTDPKYVPWFWDRKNTVETRNPLHHDSLLGDRIEFAALALAIEWAAKTGQFVSGEIGAGHGLWAASCGVTARRMGFKEVGIVALEADPARFQNLRHHLANNHLVSLEDPSIGRSDGVSWRLFQAAAAPKDGVLYWPSSGSAADAGQAATDDPSAATDYRGQPAHYQEIPAVSLATAFEGYSTVDFLQIDIQGGEYDLVANSLGFFNDHVRSMYIGTHSRCIESDFLRLLRSQDWTLVREKPCQFYCALKTPTVEAATYFDGGQLWLNERFFK